MVNNKAFGYCGAIVLIMYLLQESFHDRFGENKFFSRWCLMGEQLQRSATKSDTPASGGTR